MSRLQLWEPGPVEQAVTIHKPLLASWNHSDDPAQIRLRAYLDQIQAKLEAFLAHAGDQPLFLRLDVARDLKTGARGTALDQLLHQYDLENYLTPIVYRLGARRFKLVSATKRVAKISRLSVGFAREIPDLPDRDSWEHFVYPAAGNVLPKDWKHGLRAGLAAKYPDRLPPGPAEVHLAWRCSARRNWVWLWKPTGDAMGPILGEPNPRRPFDPNDDRIVSLGLHLTEDNALGYGLRLGLWWRSVDLPQPHAFDQETNVDIDTDELRPESRPRSVPSSTAGLLTIGTDPEPVDGEQPRVIDTDTELYWLHDVGEGWIYNDFAGRGATGHLYNVLHRATCQWLERSNVNVRKYFFPTLALAQAWLESNRGPEDINWKRCNTCSNTPSDFRG